MSNVMRYTCDESKGGCGKFLPEWKFNKQHYSREPICGSCSYKKRKTRDQAVIETLHRENIQKQHPVRELSKKEIRELEKAYEPPEYKEDVPYKRTE